MPSESTTRGLRSVEEIAVEVYRVPTDQPEADGTLEWDSTTMVLVRAGGGGCEGIGWTYGSGAAAAVVEDVLAPVVRGAAATGVRGAHERMVRACRNIGRPGIASCAISAVDIALWDLEARCMDLPLADLFGRVRGCIPAYGSGGFTTYDDATTARQVEHWVEDLGVAWVKIKIGESWGTEVHRDLDRTALVRSIVGAPVGVFVDANGAYSAKQAVRVGHRLVEESAVTWFEEPVSSDDLRGLRAVRQQCAADVAAGEYGYSPSYFAHLIDAASVDCVQIDVTRCGGYTDWLAISELAAAHGVEISGHCAPNLHAHVAVSAPHLRHLELFHDHVRIEELLFDGSLPVREGCMSPDTSAPGHGMTLRQPADRHRVA